MPRGFWLYLVGAGLIAAAYTDFPLIAFHFKDAALASDAWTPVFFAIAMGVAGASALLLGHLFDRFGMSTLIGAFFLTAFFPVMVFYGGFTVALLGIVLWGVGLGAQDSIMKAVIAHMAPATRRASLYGTFDFSFGVCWFLGSALMGFLYDQSIAALVLFSTTLQVGAVVWLLAVRRQVRRPLPASG